MNILHFNRDKKQTPIKTGYIDGVFYEILKCRYSYKKIYGQIPGVVQTRSYETERTIMNHLKKLIQRGYQNAPLAEIKQIRSV